MRIRNYAPDRLPFRQLLTRMHTASAWVRDARGPLLALAAALAASLWWSIWTAQHHASPPVLTETIAPVQTFETASLQPAKRSDPIAGSWFTTLFAPPKKSAQEEARMAIETAGWTWNGDSLVRAVQAHQPALMSLLLKAGADVDAPNSSGQTALLAAIEAGHWEEVELLLSAGADANHAGPHKISPLMAVAMADQTSAIHSLILKGAKLAIVDENGHSALHYAVVTRSLGALQLLLQSGAPVSDIHCCEGGSSLLSHAFATHDWRVIEPILTREPAHLKWAPDTRAALAEYISARDSAKTRLLLSKHPDAPTPEGRSQPLLAYALLANDLPQFTFLLDCGTNPNQTLGGPIDKTFSQAVPSEMMRDYLGSEPGMTTLMLAAGLGRTEFIQALLAKGANRGLGTSKSRMPAVLFAAEANNAPAIQALIEGSPSPDQIRIEISLGSQEASVIKSGVPIMTTEVSTGKPGYGTKPGDYVVTDKNLVHRSTIYKVPMPFFMRLNSHDFGMHEGVVPGYPASHGCIRLPTEAAKKLFKEIPLGTLVSIRE